jgi:oligosaccharyltransferase complex subunit gamma
MSAENFINFIRITQGVEVTLYRPIDWSKYVTTIVSVVGSLVALRLAFPYLVKIARNYRVWSALSLAIILMMTSGFMWNRIRHAQYIGGDGRSPMYIARGFQSQFGVETQIVAGLYAVCVFAIVALVVRVPVVQSKHKQLIILAISLGTLLLTYSGLLMLFRTKYMSYPFRLLL